MFEKVAATFIGATLALTVSKFMNEATRDDEQHWEDMAECEDAGGRPLVDGSQWFIGCLLP